jgi:BirA family transcriptional regulator, biotin operon repressor / biotin---[acetyl-CoA-carboxylase] ligase
MPPVEFSDRLVPDRIQADLGTMVIGQEIMVLEQTGSTNDAVLEIMEPDSTEGLVLFAEHQTAGRGQRGNRWESAAGKGLWFSILLRPMIDVTSSPQLTIWATQAISGVVQTEFMVKPTIKLPNDVQIDGRKVAGVLVEMRAQEKAPHVAIVGIGINVNHGLRDFPEELQSRAISLAMALGRQIDRQKFAVALLRNLDWSYRERFGRLA